MVRLGSDYYSILPFFLELRRKSNLPGGVWLAWLAGFAWLRTKGQQRRREALAAEKKASDTLTGTRSNRIVVDNLTK